MSAEGLTPFYHSIGRNGAARVRRRWCICAARPLLTIADLWRVVGDCGSSCCAARTPRLSCCSACRESARIPIRRAVVAPPPHRQSRHPFYDLERFGFRFVASPRHSDVPLVTGPVTLNMREGLKRIYDASRQRPNGSSRRALARPAGRLRGRLRGGGRGCERRSHRSRHSRLSTESDGWRAFPCLGAAASLKRLHPRGRHALCPLSFAD